MSLKSSKTRVLVNVSIELKNEAERIAEMENRSLSNYIVTLIQKDVENRRNIENEE